MDLDNTIVHAKNPLPYRRDTGDFHALRGRLCRAACGLKVESRLRENTPEQLTIGMPMKMETITVRKDDEGTDLLTFQFCAAEEQH